MNILGDIDVTSDSHGFNKHIDNWIKKGNVPNLIHCGDDGSGFVQYFGENQRLGKLLNEANKRIYVIAGNHSDPEMFDNRIYGGEWGGIQLVKNGTIATWGNEKILFNGGGLSLDRASRIPNLDYWDDEVFKFVKCDEKIDHLVTHISLTQVTGKFLTDPFVLGWCGNDAELMTDLMDEQDEVQFWLNYLIDRQGNKIKSWHYGHYHQSIESEYRGINCRCLAINEIRPFCRKEY